MSTKDEALRRISQLPADCTWADVLSAVSYAAAMERGKPGQVRELRAPWGVEPAPVTGSEEEAGVSHDYDVIIERDTEGLFVASVPALQGCHTQAPSIDLLLDRVREAIGLCLEVAGGSPSETGYVGVRRVSVGA